MKKLLLPMLVVLSGCLVSAQTNNKFKKLDSLFNTIHSNDLGMGSMSIFSNGDEIYQRSIGYSDVENNNKANATTRYRIGSITKPFTAVIIMQLLEEEKLEMDMHIDKFFPEIPNSNKITIEHLLRHESGLFNVTDDEDFKTWMVKPQTRKEMLARFIKNGTVFQPGEKAIYSNTNYLLLSYIAEEIENKSYAEVVEERIVDKLDLKNTFYGGKIDPDKNHARSYVKSEDSWVETPETDMTVPMGAGGLVSTPEDLNSFFYNLFEGNLISKSSLKAMTTTKDGIGMGLMKLPFNNLEVYGHAGGIDGFSSIAVHIPEEKLSAAYTANASDYPMNTLFIGAMKIILGMEYDLPDFELKKTMEPEILDQYNGTYGSAEFPIDVTIFHKKGILYAQGTGQPPLPLDAMGKDTFKADSHMLKLIFFPVEDRMLLEQGGQKADLTRK